MSEDKTYLRSLPALFSRISVAISGHDRRRIPADRAPARGFRFDRDGSRRTRVISLSMLAVDALIPSMVAASTLLPS
jgi:hypothetical protein